MYPLKLIPCRKGNRSHMGSIPIIPTMNIFMEKEKLVIKLRLEGNTYKQIQDQIGICKNTIIKILRKNNMLGGPIKELTNELIQKIQNRYNECHNIKIVAKEFGISYQRLKGKIIMREIKHTPRKELEKSYYKRIKEKLIKYKGGKCQICGYDRCTSALEFHHIDPLQKDFTISGGTKSFENLKPEVDKCILVCSNCHREIHAGIIKF